jgi:hypothetical protein
MGEKQMEHALRPAPVAEQATPCLPGGGLDAGCRLVALPGQDRVGDAAGGEPGADPAGLGSGFGSEAMIDGESLEAAAMGLGPGIGEEGEGQ